MFKATMAVFSSEVCSTFTAISSRTLLSDHVPKYIQEPLVIATSGYLRRGLTRITELGD